MTDAADTDPADPPTSPPPQAPTPKGAAKDEREARLAAQLRANLRRRKAGKPAMPD